MGSITRLDRSNSPSHQKRPVNVTYRPTPYVALSLWLLMTLNLLSNIYIHDFTISWQLYYLPWARRPAISGPHASNHVVKRMPNTLYLAL